MDPRRASSTPAVESFRTPCHSNAYDSSLQNLVRNPGWNRTLRGPVRVPVRGTRRAAKGLASSSFLSLPVRPRTPRALRPSRLHAMRDGDRAARRPVVRNPPRGGPRVAPAPPQRPDGPAMPRRPTDVNGCQSWTTGVIHGAWWTSQAFFPGGSRNLSQERA